MGVCSVQNVGAPSAPKTVKPKESSATNVKIVGVLSSLSRTPIEIRLKCIRLYLEGVGFRGIARLTGTPHTTVMRWIKKLGDDIDRFRPQMGEVEPVSVMELDEMWHFVQKKRTNVGSG